MAGSAWWSGAVVGGTVVVVGATVVVVIGAVVVVVSWAAALPERTPIMIGTALRAMTGRGHAAGDIGCMQAAYGQDGRGRGPWAVPGGQPQAARVTGGPAGPALSLRSTRT